MIWKVPIEELRPTHMLGIGSAIHRLMQYANEQNMDKAEAEKMLTIEKTENGDLKLFYDIDRHREDCFTLHIDWKKP